ncbi:hypothetical protein MHU86_10262 [Fragilaria crotonensis]|nr:hypothetical protein MHU86_10262 [Fragilaria crotonensis]
MDEVRRTRAIFEALVDQALQCRLSQRDDVIAITGVIHAETRVCQQRYQILREPGGILELLEDRIADHVVVVVKKCLRKDVEDFCEWISAIGQSTMSMVTTRQSSSCRSSPASDMLISGLQKYAVLDG